MAGQVNSAVAVLTWLQKRWMSSAYTRAARARPPTSCDDCATAKTATSRAGQDVRMVMHADQPKLDRRRDQVKDADGKPLLNDLVRVGSQPGGGVHHYSWQRPAPASRAVQGNLSGTLHSPWGWGDRLRRVPGGPADPLRPACPALPAHLLGCRGLAVVASCAGVSISITAWAARATSPTPSPGRHQPVLIQWRVKDEIGEVMAALQAMAGAVARRVGQVRGSVDDMVTASQEIALGSQDLSQHTGRPRHACKNPLVSGQCSPGRAREHPRPLAQPTRWRPRPVTTRCAVTRW